MTTYGIAFLSQQQPFLTHVIRTGLLQHHNLSPNQLVSAAYGKLGAIQEACLMDEPDVASWIAMITKRPANSFNECSRKGLASDELLQAALLNMYATCGDIHEARSVFDKIYEPSVVSWTSMISAYARKGYGLDALELFEKMQQEGVKPNKVTFITILSVCANLLDVVQGEMVHALIIDRGLEADVIVGNALVSMCGKCNAGGPWRCQTWKACSCPDHALGSPEGNTICIAFQPLCCRSLGRQCGCYINETVFPPFIELLRYHAVTSYERQISGKVADRKHDGCRVNDMDLRYNERLNKNYVVSLTKYHKIDFWHGARVHEGDVVMTFNQLLHHMHAVDN